jgi:hypothetical protein
LSMPSPWRLTELLVKVQPLTVTVAGNTRVPTTVVALKLPPPLRAELPVNVPLTSAARGDSEPSTVLPHARPRVLRAMGQ